MSVESGPGTGMLRRRARGVRTTVRETVRSADGRRRDVATAILLFVLGVVLLQVGLVGIWGFNGRVGLTTPEPWWWVALLAVGCLLVLVERARPVLALLGGVAVTLVDVAWGGSLAILLVLWELLFAATLHSGPRTRAWLWGVAAALCVVGAVAAGESNRDVRYFVYVGLQLGAVLLVPMWWADNVRAKTELADVERERADSAARAAELERERAADLEQLGAAQRHEAVQAERAAMARDLHDVIASHLSTIAIHSGAALSTPPDPGRDRAALTQVRESAVASLSEMRAMIELLRADAPRDPLAAPGRLDRLGDLVETARATGVDVVVEDPDGVAEAPLPAAVGQGLHRIAQEALTNARKHAPGAAVVVRLSRGTSPDAVTLRVTNAGPPAGADAVPGAGPGPAWPGVPRSAVLSAGTGLVTMRERAEGLGGTFSAGPDGDGGWVVQARVPLVEGES